MRIPRFNISPKVVVERNKNRLISYGLNIFKTSPPSISSPSPTSIHSPWTQPKLFLSTCGHQNIMTCCALNSTKNWWFSSRGTVSSSEFLQSHPAYKEFVFSIDNSNPPQVTHTQAQGFLSLANSSPDAPICDPKYEEDIAKLVASLEEFTDDELLQVLYHFKKFPRPSSPKLESYKAIWKKLDDECIRRAIQRHRWRAPVHFVMADLWYKLGLAPSSNFHWQFVKQCLRKVDRLSREQMVRFCFSLSLTSSLPKAISLYDVQYNFCRILDERPRLTSDEIAIMCLALFKSKSSLIDKPILKKIMEFVSEDAKIIPSQSLSSITKTLKLGSHKGLENDIYNFLGAFVDELDRLDLSACASLASVGTRGRVRNEHFLEALVRRVQGSLDKAPLKELELLAFALTLFNVKCQPVYEEIVQVLRAIRDQTAQDKNDFNSATQVKTLNRCLPKILISLACQNIYPEDLISLVFSTEFLNALYGPRMYYYKPELVVLDSNVRADLKDYKGNCLDTKPRGYLTKKFMTWIDPPDRRKTTPYKQTCRNVQSALIEIFGDTNFVHLCNILPHHNTIEAVFCTNESGELQLVPQSYKDKPEFEPKSLTTEDLGSKLEYHAILIYYWDHLIYNTDEPVGSLQMAKRQFENMGYTTYVLSHWSWRNCTTVGDQKDYIQRLIGNTFKNFSTGAVHSN